MGPEKKQGGVVQSPDIVFFVEDGLQSPTLNDLPSRPVDEGESVTQPVLDHSIRPTTPPGAPNAPALPPLSAAAPTALPEATPQSSITVDIQSTHHRTPARARNEQAIHTDYASLVRARGHRKGRRGRGRGQWDPAKIPTHLRILSTTFCGYLIPLRSRHAPIRNGGGRNSAMLILDEANHPPIGFSTGLPGTIQLSRLPDRRNAREAMASPTPMDGGALRTRRWQTSSPTMSIN